MSAKLHFYLYIQRHFSIQNNLNIYTFSSICYFSQDALNFSLKIMWKENIVLKIIFVFWISPKVETSYWDYFRNFICEQDKLKPQKCEIRRISSTNELQGIFNDFDKNSFKREDVYNNVIRGEISYYNEFEFKDSTFEKFPTGSFSHFSHVKSMTARNVKLSTLNRDSFTLFTSLEFLDLSYNNIQLLENNILSYMKSIKSFNVSYNQIETLNKDAFDEFGKNLTDVDLSHNNIKTVDARIFETLGKFDQVNLYLDFNKIEEISNLLSIFSTSKAQFKLLDLRHNKLKKIEFKCKNINKHIYFYTYEEEITTCKVDHLDLKDNSLISIEVLNAFSLDISNNINITNINLNLTILRKFVASNVTSKAINYEFLRNAHQLTELDMSNTFLGTPKIDTFSEMTQLKDLKLRNTGLSHIEYGMFGHQVNMKNLDISYNNIGHFDIEMLTSLKPLESLDISGNNLTSFNDVNAIKKNFPNFTSIGIEDNSWNCSYLTKLVKAFSENSISIKQPVNIMKNTSHVMGIGCQTVSNQKNKPTDPDHANDLILHKLNGIIEKIDEMQDTLLLNNERDKDIRSSSSDGSYSSTGITGIILTAIITVLVVIGVLFGYLKLKNIYNRRFEVPSVLARSTNTSTMTVEIPFGDRKF